MIACIEENGWDCGSDEPSLCSRTCGNGRPDVGEGCDDGNLMGGDGCSAACALETGYTCSGAPSSCSPVCGDGLMIGGEACDDNGTVPGDGCSATCTIEDGFGCLPGDPSVCAPVCGFMIQSTFGTTPEEGRFTS